MTDAEPSSIAPPPAPVSWASRLPSRITFKAVAIGALALALLIPLLLVQWTVSERRSRFDEAVQSIGGSWGPAQRLLGPALSMSFTIPNENPASTDQPRTETLLLFPDRLQIGVQLRVERRARGPFEANIYRAEIALDGEFLLTDVMPRIGKGKPDWKSTELLLAMTDLRGVVVTADSAAGGAPVAFDPAGAHPVLGTAIKAPLTAAPDPAGNPRLPFRLRLSANGSQQFTTVPVGRDTKMTLSANWDSPSFMGAFLPAAWNRQADGFTANWQVGHLGRGIPQALLGSDAGSAVRALQASVLGVDLLTPVSAYRAAERATKYGALFIFLTFAVFLLSERVSGHVLHVVQYGLVGLSLCLYFLTLLALSEHLVFPAAFFVSAAATVAQTGAYVRAATRDWRPASIHAATIGGLYAFLYVLLQLEDHALLVGSGFLFAVISALMYATRGLAYADRDVPRAA